MLPAWEAKRIIKLFFMLREDVVLLFIILIGPRHDKFQFILRNCRMTCLEVFKLCMEHELCKEIHLKNVI